MQLANLSIDEGKFEPGLELPIIEENIQSMETILQSIHTEMAQRYEIKVQEWLQELARINFIDGDIFQVAQHLAQEEISLSDQISDEELTQLRSLMPSELIVSSPGIHQTAQIPVVVLSNPICSMPSHNLSYCAEIHTNTSKPFTDNSCTT